MRLISYILIGLGAALAVIALAFVLLDDENVETVAPQTSGTSTAVQTETATSDTSATTGEATSDSADLADSAAEDGSGSTVVAEATSNELAVDLVQVKPDGAAVFAGQSEPNAKIIIFEGDVLLGETVADENGEWVVVLEKNLGPGEHLISVGAENASGESEVAGITMAISVGETDDEQPLVALLPQSSDSVPKLLQSPDDKPLDPAAAAGEDASDTGDGDTADGDASQIPVVPALAPRSLTWKGEGELMIAGASRGGQRVDALIGERAFGSGQVAADGGWQVTGIVDMSVPKRNMTFILRDGDGAAVASYELPVATRDLSQGLDGSRMVVVQRGDALWRIAFQSYGEGIKYVDIVRRNAAAISDPDLIYPNQIFTIPE